MVMVRAAAALVGRVRPRAVCCAGCCVLPEACADCGRIVPPRRWAAATMHGGRSSPRLPQTRSEFVFGARRCVAAIPITVIAGLSEPSTGIPPAVRKLGQWRTGIEPTGPAVLRPSLSPPTASGWARLLVALLLSARMAFVSATERGCTDGCADCGRATDALAGALCCRPPSCPASGCQLVFGAEPRRWLSEAASYAMRTAAARCPPVLGVRFDFVSFWRDPRRPDEGVEPGRVVATLGGALCSGCASHAPRCS